MEFESIKAYKGKWAEITFKDPNEPPTILTALIEDVDALAVSTTEGYILTDTITEIKAPNYKAVKKYIDEQIAISKNKKDISIVSHYHNEMLETWQKRKEILEAQEKEGQ